jgi:serine/threonine protein kinase
MGESSAFQSVLSNIDGLLSRWSKAFKVGRDIPAEELAKDHPELIEELASRIAHQKNSKFEDKSSLGSEGQQSGDRSCAPSCLQAGDEPLPGFRLIKRLGKGAFGEVWSAGDNEHPFLPKYALKIISEHRKSHAKEEQEGLEQMKWAGHPNLLKRHWHQVSGNTLIIVTELAEASLDKHFAKLRHNCSLLSLCAQAVYLLRGVAGALDYLQAEGKLTHQDVKPSNLLLINGRCKLGDFGTVRPLKRPAADDAGLASSHDEIILVVPGEEDSIDEGGTMPFSSLSEVPWDEAVRRGATLYTAEGAWTPRYAAPERFNGRISISSDQYSLALTFCELVADRVPFHVRDADQRDERVAGRMDLAFLPEAVRHVVWRSLSPEPENRFPCCSNLITSLRDALLPLLEDSTAKNYLIGEKWSGRQFVPVRRPPPTPGLTLRDQVWRSGTIAAHKLMGLFRASVHYLEWCEEGVSTVLSLIWASIQGLYPTISPILLVIVLTSVPALILWHCIKRLSGLFLLC